MKSNGQDVVSIGQASVLVAAWIAVAAIASYAFGWYSWRYNDHPLSDLFAVLMVVDATWALGYLLTLVSPTDGLSRLLMAVPELSAALAAVVWFLFVLEYTGNGDRLPAVATPLLVAHAFVYGTLYAINPGNLVRGPIEIATFGVLRVPHETFGPGILLEILLVYTLLTTSLVLLGRFFLD
ncbi:MAG: histidine kinase N-terminal 7TM domain-containing protein, partial [Halovenus sp.]